MVTNGSGTPNIFPISLVGRACGCYPQGHRFEFCIGSH